MPVEKTNKYFPLLRFPAFQSTEQWKTKKLGDIAELYAGATPSTSVSEYWTEGTIPWMSSGEVHNGQIFVTEKKITPLGYDKSSTKMVPANSVIVALAGQGKTRGSVAITRISLCTNQSLCSILPNETYDSDYLYFFLKSQYETLRFISSGDGTRGGLNLQMLRDFLIPFPSLEEQHIIALFLSSIDSFISSINGKVEQLKIHKKSLMQKLFPQKGQTAPVFRFPEFNTEWKKVTLGDIFVERREHSTITDDLPQLSFTIEEGVIYPNNKKTNKRDFLINDKDNKKFLVTYIDDIIYNPANVIYGAIHKNSLCNGVVSPIYKIFSTSQDASFMEYVVRMPEFIQKMSTYMEGTVLKLRTLKPESFLKMEVFIAPSLAEQRKIAECLSSIDKTIEYYTKKSVILEQHKKGLMQQLFPKLKEL